MPLNPDSRRDSFRNKAKMILNMIDHFSGRSSTCYAVVAAMKIVALLFVIIVAVECVFYFRYCFWFLCGLSISLARFTFKITLKIAMFVFYYGLKIFMGSMKVVIYCLKSITLFALYSVFTVLRFLIAYPSDWALNLRIDLRSFLQLCCFCSFMKMVSHWNKHGARNFVTGFLAPLKRPKSTSILRLPSAVTT